MPKNEIENMTSSIGMVSEKESDDSGRFKIKDID